ncbi:protease complex subunit PrcB family protein [Brevibacillus sp. TJ4]|uniref:protease complex subunit PrcB family protein n=1 Tax=Brevibacillus sp. TJ4 TaxID=3234853 RepID=UPI0037D495FB
MKLMLPAVLLASTLAFPVNHALTPPHPTASETVTEEGAAYETVAAPYPPAVQEALKKVRKSGGHTIVRTNGKAYVVVSAGQRPTGGYSLVADQVKKTGAHHYTLQLRVKAPAAGAMKTQVISYPTLVVALPDQQAQVRINIR